MFAASAIKLGPRLRGDDSFWATFRSRVMRPLRYLRLWLALGLAYVAFVLWASLSTLPIPSGPVGFDKLLHLAAYLFLCGWFCALFHRHWHVYILLAAVALGLSLEVVQGYGGVRVFEFYDLLANTLGAAGGFALIGWTALRDVFPRIEQHLPRAQH